MIGGGGEKSCPFASRAAAARRAAALPSGATPSAYIYSRRGGVLEETERERGRGQGVAHKRQHPPDKMAPARVAPACGLPTLRPSPIHMQQHTRAANTSGGRGAAQSGREAEQEPFFAAPLASLAPDTPSLGARAIGQWAFRRRPRPSAEHHLVSKPCQTSVGRRRQGRDRVARDRHKK